MADPCTKFEVSCGDISQGVKFQNGHLTVTALFPRYMCLVSTYGSDSQPNRPTVHAAAMTTLRSGAKLT